MKLLQVWLCVDRLGGEQVRKLVAAPSRVAAARLMLISSKVLKTYGTVTGNSEDRALALAAPGAVFFRSVQGGEWRRMDRQPMPVFEAAPSQTEINQSLMDRIIRLEDHVANLERRVYSPEELED